MRHPTLAIIAAVLGLIGLGALSYYLATRPTTLRIAVGPVGNENVRVIGAAVQTLQREREAFRLRMVLTEGSEHSSRLLDKGDVDLAVLRPDVAYPRSGATVAVMRVDHLVIVAPGGNGITRLADLKGRAIAIFRESPGNVPLLRILTEQAGLAEQDIRVERIRLAELKQALESGRVDAVLAVGPASGRQLFDVVNVTTEAGKGEVSFLPVIDNKAIELRHPLLEAETLVRGLFGGMSPRPAEDVPTLTLSHLLLASKSLPDTTVSDFSRVFISAKALIATEAPLASRIEAPDQEKEGPIPIHPGTITYLDGQTTTFLERYGDWFYIALMGLGIGGSGLAGYFSWATAKARRATMSMLGRLQGLISEARLASDPAQLDAIRTEADALFSELMGQAIENNLDSAGTLAFHMALSELREAVHDRRQALENA